MNEVDEVKQLGERIGYGRLMQIASQQWSKMLTEKYGISGTGAFVPAIHFQIKEEEKERLRQEYPDAFPDK